MSIENIRDNKTVCYVKVIQNHKLPESFDMKMILYPLKKVEVTIITPNQIQLAAIVHEMKKTYGMSKFAFRVQFNWTNVPKEIRKDPHFKAEIYNIFQNTSVNSFVTEEQFKNVISGGVAPVEINQSNENIVILKKITFDKESLESYVDLVRTHIVDYGNAPDFSARTSVKNQKKIHNYIKSVCSLPYMPMETALSIASLI